MILWFYHLHSWAFFEVLHFLLLLLVPRKLTSPPYGSKAKSHVHANQPSIKTWNIFTKLLQTYIPAVRGSHLHKCLHGRVEVLCQCALYLEHWEDTSVEEITAAVSSVHFLWAAFDDSSDPAASLMLRSLPTQEQPKVSFMVEKWTFILHFGGVGFFSASEAFRVLCWTFPRQLLFNQIMKWTGQSLVALFLLKCCSVNYFPPRCFSFSMGKAMLMIRVLIVLCSSRSTATELGFVNRISVFCIAQIPCMVIIDNNNNR